MEEKKDGAVFFKDYIVLNNTKSEYSNSTIYELIAKQALLKPHNIALEFNGLKITYIELIDKVNHVAQFLKFKGIQPGDFIAISIPRGVDLIYSMLAVLKCRAAYLPLDPAYPKARLEFMMNDSEAKALLTSADIINTLPSLPNTIVIEDAFSQQNESTSFLDEQIFLSEDLVYILYTSGSTGKPKGVPITNKNLVNFISSMTKEPGIEVTDRLLSITTISFDIAGLEIYLPLVNGATLVLIDNETAKDGRLLLEFVKKGNINILQATPTTWQMLLDSGWSEKLPVKALCGGEALPLDLAKALLEKCDSLWNMYGPTETTIWSAIKQITKSDSIISIGKPIANTQIYIIDEAGQLLGPGKIGEIAIAGDGLSKGYWKRPELTTEKFIKSSFTQTNEEILYRTGDLGNLLAINEIECLGRIDQQVKIRGHRIEPGEIEQVLISLNGVKNAVVLANENFLIAHIVPDSNVEEAKKNIPIWLDELSSLLPSHLIPNDFNLVDKYPTTLNGKIDRKALMEFKTTVKIDYTAPRTVEEKIVAAIWMESLKLEKIDIFSNFFEIGGHSIIAVRVMSKLEQKIGKRFPLSTLFEHSTIEKIAKLFNTEGGKFSDCIVPLKTNGKKVPIFIVHGAGLNVLNLINLSKQFDDEQPVYGIQGTGPNGYENWYESIEAMAAYYNEAIVKIHPEGPYALSGFSFGGVIAFEMARQLIEDGKKVSFIGMLDTNIEISLYYKHPLQKKMMAAIDKNHKRLKYLIQMLRSWTLFKLRINDKKEYLLQKYLGKKEPMSEHDALAFEEFVEADRMVHGIRGRYQLLPQNISIDLFKSKDEKSYKTDPMYLGWEKVALGGIRIHEIPGSHLDIVSPPNDKFLAKLIQEALDQRHLKP